MYESLHNHTVISDGTQTHVQALVSAEATGFGTIVFTDHDVFPTLEIMRELNDYAGPVCWDIGIELSCGLPAELGGVDKGNVHVLGYFCDPNNVPLTDYLDKLKVSRYVRLERQVKHLLALSFDISVDAVLAIAGPGAPGMHHVVKALLAVPANIELTEKIRQEFATASQNDVQLQSLYTQMMERGPVQYPYALFMKASSFKPMSQDTLGNAMVDMDVGVQLIREAGGVAVLAHWYFHEDQFSRLALEAVLTQGRLDGLETAVFNQQLGDATYSDAINYLEQLAHMSKCASVMGIDGHYATDFQYFLDHGDADATIGQYQRLRDQFPQSFDLRKA